MTRQQLTPYSFKQILCPLVCISLTTLTVFQHLVISLSPTANHREKQHELEASRQCCHFHCRDEESVAGFLCRSTADSGLESRASDYTGRILIGKQVSWRFMQENLRLRTQGTHTCRRLSQLGSKPSYPASHSLLFYSQLLGKICLAINDLKSFLFWL